MKETATKSENSSNKSSTNERLKILLGNNDIPWKIYLSRALSAWSERIWLFGAGIFMVNLQPENLRLVAIYGFVLSVSVILFSPYVGKWIDQSQRLKAAIICLIVQNLSTTLCCIFLGFFFAEVSLRS